MSLPTRLLLAILLAAAATALAWVFARAVQRSSRWARGEQALFDRAGHWLAPRLVATWADISALGSSTLVTLFGALFTAALWADGRTHDALLMAASTVLPGVLGRGLKRITSRERPGEPAAVFFGSSMPSNHTLMAGALWGSASLMVAGSGLPAWLAGAATLVALGITFAVGLSRVLLRVHYPSDVLAGWWLAASWVAAIALLRG